MPFRRCFRRLLLGCLCAAALLSALPTMHPVRAATLGPGDIVVLAQVAGLSPVLMRVDPISGDREIIANSASSQAPPLDLAGGNIALAPNDDLLYLDSIGTRILRVEPSSGDRAIVTLRTNLPIVGDGPRFQGPNYLQAEANGQILVTDTRALYRVDPLTGNRSILSGLGVGDGPSIDNNPSGIAVAGDGRIFVGHFYNFAIYQVDPLFGDRAIVSDNSGDHGAGPQLGYVFDIALNSQGQLFATGFDGADLTAGIIYRVDASTGDRTVISSAAVGSGPQLSALDSRGLAIDADDSLLVADGGKSQLFRVNPVTGERTILSDNTHGAGPEWTFLFDVLVTPVPEPSTMVLCILAIVTVAVRATIWNHAC